MGAAAGAFAIGTAYGNSRTVACGINHNKHDHSGNASQIGNVMNVPREFGKGRSCRMIDQCGSATLIFSDRATDDSDPPWARMEMPGRGVSAWREDQLSNADDFTGWKLPD